MREVFEAWIKLFPASKKLSQALATEQAWREGNRENSRASRGFRIRKVKSPGQNRFPDCSRYRVDPTLWSQAISFYLSQSGFKFHRLNAVILAWRKGCRLYPFLQSDE
jgi:hypothetical protein